MAHTTTILTKNEDGKEVELRFITEEYIVGTYIVMYYPGDSIPMQSCSTKKAPAIHKMWRSHAAINGDIVVMEKSTPMERIQESSKTFWAKNRKFA